jgi:CheY-like chemotaxis protein
MSSHGQSIRPVVLLVEDEPLVRMDAADVLEHAGFEVIEAADAGAAQAALESRDDIHVLFTDVQMPGPMNGLELAWLVHDHQPHICVLITSGHIRPEQDKLPERAVFIAKPYAEQVPTTVIRTLLEKRAGSP